MAAAIHENIINALSTMLATITTNNGYRTEIATVEVKSKDWAELQKSEANATDGGWMGIVPQEETYIDRPGVVESTWRIALTSHIRIAAATEAAAITAASNLATDVRKLLYDTNGGNLGVTGVHMVKMVRRQDSLGSPEAINERWATARIDIDVKLEEAASLS